MAASSSDALTPPKAQLYSFPGSVWASVPLLALIEKGYHADDVEIKTVDLLKGENFSPLYIRLNPKATLPTLVVPLAETITSEVDTKFRAITNTHAVVQFLDKSRNVQILEAKGENGSVNPAPVLAPATIDDQVHADDVIKLLHSDEADPNFLLLGARTREELHKQRDGLQGTFCKNRFEAIQRFRSETAASATSTENPRTQQQNAALLNWYDDKLAAESLLTRAYLPSQHAGADASSSAAAAAEDALIAATVTAWRSLAASVLPKLEAAIRGPFVLGGQISLVDLHLGAWLARVLAVSQGLYPLGGAGTGADGSDGSSAEALPDALEKALQWDGLALGADAMAHAVLGPKVRAYWKTVMQRPSFQEVYKDGPH